LRRRTWRRARRSLSFLQPSLQHRVSDDTDPVRQSGFDHRVGLVRLDGFDADAKLRGDLLAEESERHEPKHVLFASAQVTVCSSAAASPAAHRADDLIRDRWIEILLTGDDTSNGADEFFSGALLEDVAVRACLQQTLHVAGVAVPGE